MSTLSSAPKPLAEPAPGTLEAHVELHLAVISFIHANANFESSVVVNEFLEAIRGCSTGMDLFAAPIKAKLLSMDGAMKWALFMQLAPGIAAEEAAEAEAADREGAAASSPVASAAPFGTDYNAGTALTMIGQIYDVSTADIVHSCFDDDESDDDSEDGSDGSDLE